ncbi:MAG: dTDP-4-dehydrorhamnose 3,5-epimerase family protein [Planctomycetes bacterium]|nr:dTDP-4-dehydrorhamnose 3,5-epimerase family protein [Planctomycetota bacterium]
MGSLISADDMPGVELIRLKSYPDSRGRFLETFRQNWFPGRPTMLQGNRSDSQANVLRGLHFHTKQSDYWYVPQGYVYVGLADLRRGSPTEGKIVGLELGKEDLGLYIPPGVAHGYYAPVAATMTYQVDFYYDNSDEFGVAWDDPELQIPWPLTGGAPILSDRDLANPRVAELDRETIPAYAELPACAF